MVSTCEDLLIQASMLPSDAVGAEHIGLAKLAPGLKGLPRGARVRRCGWSSPRIHKDLVKFKAASDMRPAAEYVVQRPNKRIGQEVARNGWYCALNSGVILPF